MTFRPLQDIRVLDLTTFLSGPFATQILGDLGADVIKVESPQGDQTRALPPHFVGADSAYFLHVNRNKRSLSVDLKSSEGREIVQKIAQTCDVVVENFRPGVVDKLGLSYETLAALNPKLTWCSVSGFGQTGPYRDRPAYDMIVQALSGAMSLTGEPTGRPLRLGIPIGDLAAGMYAVIGILASVYETERTGKGQKLDVSMLDGLISLLSYQATYAMLSGIDPRPQGRGHDSIPTYRCFTTADGADIAVTANTERMWCGLCDALGLTTLPDDPRFATNEDRHRERAMLDPILETAFARFRSSEILRRLHDRNVPVAKVATVLEALNNPQSRARALVDILESGDGRRAPVVILPIRAEGMQARTARYPPTLGEHSREILTTLLDKDDADVDALLQRGVIGGVAKGSAG